MYVHSFPFCCFPPCALRPWPRCASRACLVPRARVLRQLSETRWREGQEDFPCPSVPRAFCPVPVPERPRNGSAGRGPKQEPSVVSAEQGELWRRLRARDWSGKGLALLPRRSAVPLRGRAEGTPVAYERPCNGSFLGTAVAHVRPGGSSNSLQRSSECVNDCLRNILDTLIFFFCKPRPTPGKYCLRPIMQGKIELNLGALPGPRHSRPFPLFVALPFVPADHFLS